MRIRSLAAVLVLSISFASRAVAVPEQALAPADRLRLAEAFRLAREVGDEIWPGWSQAPFPVLLVLAEHEVLLRDAPCPPDFTALGRDPRLERELCRRPRTAAPNLRATYPAVGGIPTAVVGTAEGTGLGSTEWVLMLLHEHFHQLQMSRPGYWDAVAALDLAGGDETGMWMLSYPFPYTDDSIAEALGAVAKRLASEAPGDASSALTTALGTLRPADARYLAFQIWQEGIARYTEIAVAERAASSFTPSPEFVALADARPIQEVARELREQTLNACRKLGLKKSGREALYPLGAALALALDRQDPSWKNRYWNEVLRLPRASTVRE